MANENDLAEKATSALLAFIDFLYAVVFGFIVADAFAQVVNETSKTWSDKAASLFLVVSVFYFVAWDWLHARLLILKNPYRSYRRFFYDIVIACFAYGAASAAIKGWPSFLLYLALNTLCFLKTF